MLRSRAARRVTTRGAKFSYGNSGIYQKSVLVLHRTCPLYYQFYLKLGHEHSERCYYTSNLLALCMTSYH
jgi:hypothetical protein